MFIRIWKPIVFRQKKSSAEIILTANRYKTDMAVRELLEPQQAAYQLNYQAIALDTMFQEFHTCIKSNI